ncbi:helix-turn-helix domain-containing protein [Aureimonas altamirensis]|uniref:helix-turn-helix domain-containing protein n=1 Tax=Aureimonas altamirensis TaxID=370622 RepID=UPI001E30FBD4|nr:helix-turn-helix transcriptional regulator [Aureimonas altamirensis]UHD46419.1 helix-turn-helix domain-containing protein [Aureimonas altamirensis]
MNEHNHRIHIGGRLRHARKVMGLSLKQVAEKVDCSESFVSKLERDKVQPSLTLLHRLVGVLGINVSHLFETAGAEDEQVFIVRGNSRPRIQTVFRPNNNGVILEQVTPLGPQSLLQANIHVVSPQGAGMKLSATLAKRWDCY